MSEEYKHGRGAQFNPHNRFLKAELAQEHIEGIDEQFELDIRTQYFYDNPKKVVNKLDSPDLRMEYSLNPYQGCEHGCIYCYARNAHEYWGFSAGHDFESKIIIKQNAPELLRKALDNKNWRVAPISVSGNTDCYQPIERKLKLTRQILEICLEYGQPVSMITKNAVILRDLDVLSKLAEKGLVHVMITITGLNEELRRVMEPRTVTYNTRLNVVEKLHKAGVPVGVMVAPVIPGLTDHEIPAVLKEAGARGAHTAGYTIVRLNGAIGSIFKDWLYKNFPDRADKVWGQIENCHGGSVNDSRLGVRIKGEGVFAANIKQLFDISVRKYLKNKADFEFNTQIFKKNIHNQLKMFE